MCVGVHVRLRVGVGVYNYMHVFVTWMCNALLMRLSVGVHAGVCRCACRGCVAVVIYSACIGVFDLCCLWYVCD